MGDAYSYAADLEEKEKNMPTSPESTKSELSGTVCDKPIDSNRYKCDSYYGGRCVGARICDPKNVSYLNEVTQPETSFGAGAPRKGNDPVLPENENHVGLAMLHTNDTGQYLYPEGDTGTFTEPPESTTAEPEIGYSPDTISELDEINHADRSMHELEQEWMKALSELPSKLPDSGERREFETGSVRDIRDGKGRYDLLSPIALESIAKRMEDGMQKYGERNWEKGQYLMSYIDSCLRHIFGYLEDVMIGRKSAEDHMSAALWNLHGFIHTQRMINEGLLPYDLDDLPTPDKVGLKRQFMTTPENTGCCGAGCGSDTKSS